MIGAVIGSDDRLIDGVCHLLISYGLEVQLILEPIVFSIGGGIEIDDFIAQCIGIFVDEGNDLRFDLLTNSVFYGVGRQADVDLLNANVAVGVHQRSQARHKICFSCFGGKVNKPCVVRPQTQNDDVGVESETFLVDCGIEVRTVGNIGAGQARGHGTTFRAKIFDQIASRSQQILQNRRIRRRIGESVPIG